MELAETEMKLPTTARTVDRSELYTADELFFCGTGAQIASITEVDRRPIGDGKPGPISSRIQETYISACRGNMPKYLKWLTPVYSKKEGKVAAKPQVSSSASTS
jgi:branched-chain amino acid aminotransferase